MQEFRSDWYGSFEKCQTIKHDYMCILHMKYFNGSKNLFGLRRPLCQWGGELARRWQEGVGGAGGEGVNLCFPQSILNLGGQGRLLREPSDPDHGRRGWLGILQQQRRLLLWQQRLWKQPGIEMQKVQKQGSKSNIFVKKISREGEKTRFLRNKGRVTLIKRMIFGNPKSVTPPIGTFRTQNVTLSQKSRIFKANNRLLKTHF